MIRQGSPTGGRRRLTRWELEREAEARERARNLAELMAELREARETEAEWYMWIVNGRPILTAEEYARVSRLRSPRKESTESPRDRGRESPSTGDRSAQGTLA